MSDKSPQKNGLANGTAGDAVNSPSGEMKFSDKLQDAWRVVEKSRHSQRPHTMDYINKIFSDYEEIRGDRTFGEDAALVTGMGILRASFTNENSSTKDRKIFFVGHQKGRTTKQKIERNFGMAKPEGYRKAKRVFEMAERFKKPLLAFIDTPGAYPGIGAEERGQSEAIASSILGIFKVKVPTLGVVIGEGGSGGALAIGVTDRLLMLENSTYSVISPESCAAILWGNSGESKRAAWALKLAAKDTLRLGVCDEVISEAGAGAHEDLEGVCLRLLKSINHHFDELIGLTQEQRMEARYKKYRYIDHAHLG